MVKGPRPPLVSAATDTWYTVLGVNPVINSWVVLLLIILNPSLLFTCNTYKTTMPLTGGGGCCHDTIISVALMISTLKLAGALVGADGEHIQYTNKK